MDKEPFIKTLHGKIIIGVSIAAVLAGAGFLMTYKNTENTQSNISNEQTNNNEDIDKTEEITEEVVEDEEVNEIEEDIENEDTSDIEDEVIEEEETPQVEIDESIFTTKQVYNANSLNVRMGPDSSYDKIGSLPRGAKVKEYATEGDWSIIEFKDGIGYVASEYLTENIQENKPNTKPNTDKYSNVIWSYSTKYQTGIPRAKNVELASSRINNTVIRPGEQVSYKDLIGDITIANGYVNAPVMVNGVANKSGVGGGVCQVSTTLYVAALKSGLTDIVSRNHSGRVSYVPAGWDAVISDGQDLKIRNTYDEDIMISSYCTGGKLVVEFKSENALLNGKTYDLRTSSSNNGLTVKLNMVEKYNGSETVVYTRTSNYVR